MLVDSIYFYDTKKIIIVKSYDCKKNPIFFISSLNYSTCKQILTSNHAPNYFISFDGSFLRFHSVVDSFAHIMLNWNELMLILTSFFFSRNIQMPDSFLFSELQYPDTSKAPRADLLPHNIKP